MVFLYFTVLYHAAILQSGSTVYNGRSNNARETIFQVGRGIDNTFSSNDSTDLLKLLQSAPADKILNVSIGEYYLTTV